MIRVVPRWGCLGCNRKATERYFQLQGIPLEELCEVERRQVDAVVCDDCGRAWLRIRKPRPLFQECVGPT